MDASKTEDPWSPFDFSKFDAYISGAMDNESNRVKRRAKVCYFLYYQHSSMKAEPSLLYGEYSVKLTGLTLTILSK